jgi:hypothetical protein
MTFAASQPQLRLVGMDDDARIWREGEQAHLAVVKENRIAAHSGVMQPGFADAIDARDPRWVLAMQTKSRLQGATLTPERRDQLMTSGRKLGLRPFETNLIIAIVQDQARRGESKDSVPLLAVVSPASELPRTQPAMWPKWFAAFAAAAAVVAALIRWLGA